MNRRQIVVGGLVALGLGAGYTAYRRMKPGMHGMSGGMRHQMPGMPDVRQRIMAIPEGRPLPELQRLMNESSQPGRFVGSLVSEVGHAEFVKGKLTRLFGYNGQSPGPVIEATEGDRISINVANKLPDRDTTVHWHGLDIPSDQDGNPMDPIKPGASRLYDFELPAGNTGPFWYHPHPHTDTPEQVYMGLAAPFIVRPKADPLAGIPETTLFITSLSLLQDGSIAPNSMADWMNGREGDHILINGAKNPTLGVAPGSSRRFRIYNATNGRYLRLSFDGHKMTLVGSDGGYLRNPVPGLDEVLLAPAERAEVVIDFENGAGQSILRNRAYERGWMGPGRPALADQPIMTINRSDVPQKPFGLPRVLRGVDALGAPVATKRLVLGERMSMGGSGMSMQFLINGKTFDMGRIDLTSRVGDIELWEIENPTDMDHPMHIHGTQFQVVERQSAGRKTPAPILSWKDTVNVARGETVRLKVKQSMKGPRMYHCHILEHEKMGMMGVVNVV